MSGKEVKLTYLEICLPLIIMEYSSNNESKGIVKLGIEPYKNSFKGLLF